MIAVMQLSAGAYIAEPPLSSRIRVALKSKLRGCRYTRLPGPIEMVT